ncbi:type IV conjugative transfer system protein TraL [Photobacterium leiognathi]|uniref:type IV conjugative transfer system protein TraL n=1 Tax=Photobacterium leiognathi TaxID=553611 RepID=UPI00273945B0|nr:type IV conjugative transfer system protein TraL [Photobacterium leiognathi]
MDDEHTFYQIPHYLDQGRLIMGMPWVEVTPTLAVFGVFAMQAYMLVGLLAASAVFIAMRTIRQGKGDNYLPLVCYWYLPKGVTQRYFRHTPASEQRYWLN